MKTQRVTKTHRFGISQLGVLVFVLWLLGAKCQSLEAGGFKLGTDSIVLGPGAGASSVTLADPSFAPWSAAASAEWLHLVSGYEQGLISTNVIFDCDANPGSTRTAAISIADQTLTVTQAGATYVQVPATNSLAILEESGGYALNFGPSGDLFITDPIQGLLFEWLSASNILLTVGAWGYGNAGGAAFDGTNDLYFCDTSSVDELNLADDTVSTVIASNLLDPRGLALDSYGNLYIADWRDNVVKKWSFTNSELTTLDYADSSWPVAVATDIAGNVFIADSGPIPAGAVKKWDAVTGLVTTLVSFDLNEPACVAVDGSGNVYFGNNYLGAIGE